MGFLPDLESLHRFVVGMDKTKFHSVSSWLGVSRRGESVLVRPVCCCTKPHLASMASTGLSSGQHLTQLPELLLVRKDDSGFEKAVHTAVEDEEVLKTNSHV